MENKTDTKGLRMFDRFLNAPLYSQLGKDTSKLTEGKQNQIEGEALKEHSEVLKLSKMI